MKQTTAKQRLLSPISYPDLIERKQNLFFDLIEFEITEELVKNHVTDDKVLVIISDKHQCLEAVNDWPADGKLIYNPVSGNQTPVVLSRTKAAFLDEDGNDADIQLEVHSWS